MEICYWTYKVLLCDTLEQMRSVMTDFNRRTWTLEDRAMMSSTYTPKLLKIIGKGSAEEEKNFLMEEFADLCWRKAA